MIKKLYSFALDCVITSNIPYMEFVMNDTNVNYIDIALNNNGTAINLTGCTLSIIFKKPDGTTVSGDTTIVDAEAGKIEYLLGTPETSVSGKILATLQVYKDTQRLTSAVFDFRVRNELDNGSAVVSSTEYPILTGLIVNCQEIVAEEIIRVSAENIRVSTENTRISNEVVRESSEDIRVSNEDIRIGNESTRTSSENTRISTEDARISAETIRISNEDNRESNESNRMSAEMIRINNEDTRVSAEDLRLSAEATRISNESSRVSSENSRVSAESTRQSSFTTSINNCNTATSSANTATSGANTATTNANNAANSTVTVWKSPVTNYAAITTSYPSPANGWQTQTLDNGNVYRYNGSIWKYIANASVVPNVNYIWIEQKTINVGGNSFTLTNSIGISQKLLVYDSKYGCNWIEGIHWNRSGQIITLTESALVETLTFQIINLG